MLTLYFLQRSILEWQDRLIAILMAAFSGMLHLVLLLTPLPPEKQPEPEPEEELTEQIIQIKSLKVAASPKAPPPEAPPPEAPPPEAPPPKAPPPVPPLNPEPPSSPEAPAPAEEAPVEPPTEATTPQETPVTSPSPAPESSPTTPPPPEAPPGTPGATAEEIRQLLETLRSQFVSSLRADASAIGSEGGVGAEDLAEIEAYIVSLPFEQLAVDSTPFGSGEALRAGALGSLALPRVSLGNALEKVEAVLASVGFSDIVEAGKYGDSQLLKAKNADGAELYVSLVKQKLGSGAFVVLWPQDPNTLP